MAGQKLVASEILGAGMSENDKEHLDSHVIVVQDSLFNETETRNPSEIYEDNLNEIVKVIFENPKEENLDMASEKQVQVQDVSVATEVKTETETGVDADVKTDVKTETDAEVKTDVAKPKPKRKAKPKKANAKTTSQAKKADAAVASQTKSETETKEENSEMLIKTNVTMAGIDLTGLEYKEPVKVTTKTVDFDLKNYVVDAKFQNRESLDGKEVKIDDKTGLKVSPNFAIQIAESLVGEAVQGNKIANFLPPLTIGVYDGKEYLIGGWHRAFAILAAREMLTDKNKIPSKFRSELNGTKLSSFRSNLTKVRVSIYECDSEMALQMLADQENSDSQHGGKALSPKEYDAIIRRMLANPFITQYSDNAIAGIFLHAPHKRGKVQLVRKQMYGENKGETRISINGKPVKASRPGAFLIENMNRATKDIGEAGVELGNGKEDHDSFETWLALGVVWVEEYEKINASTFVTEKEKKALRDGIAKIASDAKQDDPLVASEKSDAEQAIADAVKETETETDDNETETDDTTAADDKKDVMSQIAKLASGNGSEPQTDTDIASQELTPQDQVTTLDAIIVEAKEIMQSLEIDATEFTKITDAILKTAMTQHDMI